MNEPTLVTYHPKPGCEAALLELVRAHWPLLHRLGLSTATPARLWRAVDKQTGAVSYVELFAWATPDASDVAHRTPEVMALWGAMEAQLATMTLARVEPLEPAQA